MRKQFIITFESKDYLGDLLMKPDKLKEFIKSRIVELFYSWEFISIEEVSE